MDLPKKTMSFDGVTHQDEHDSHQPLCKTQCNCIQHSEIHVAKN